MTTPSKLSLKKKIRQKLESGSRNDGEEEKENVPRCSDNLSDRSSRRCSTIIAGNLGLGGNHQDPGEQTRGLGGVWQEEGVWRRKQTRGIGGVWGEERVRRRRNDHRGREQLLLVSRARLPGRRGQSEDDPGLGGGCGGHMDDGGH